MYHGWFWIHWYSRNDLGFIKIRNNKRNVIENGLKKTTRKKNKKKMKT